MIPIKYTQCIKIIYGLEILLKQIALWAKVTISIYRWNPLASPAKDTQTCQLLYLVMFVVV